MLLIDALTSGSVILLVTTPEAGKPDCRLDFICVQEGEINKVRRALVDKLSDEKIDFNISSLEMPRDKQYKTIVMDASSTSPFDYDRKKKSTVSNVLLNTPGVLEFTSARTSIGDVNKETIVALFASIIKNVYITSNDAVSLVYQPSSTPGSGDFKFKMMNLSKVGSYDILDDTKDHFGLVKLNKSEEFYMRDSDVEAVVKADAKTESQPVPTKRIVKDALIKAKESNTIRSLVSDNKTVSAGLGVVALVALGTLANKSSNNDSSKKGISTRGGIFSSKKNEEEVAGKTLTRSEALELYKSL